MNRLSLKEKLMSPIRFSFFHYDFDDSLDKANRQELEYFMVIKIRKNFNIGICDILIQNRLVKDVINYGK